MKLRWITVYDKYGVKDTYLQYWNTNREPPRWDDIPSIQCKDNELDLVNHDEDGAY